MVSFVDAEHPSCPLLGELLGCLIRTGQKNLQGHAFQYLSLFQGLYINCVDL